MSNEHPVTDFKWSDGGVVIPHVQMRNNTAGHAGTNKFEGERVYLCQECRKSNKE